MRLILLNPNTNRATTGLMVDIARESAPAGIIIDGMTVADGVPLITEPQALARAGIAVVTTLACADLAGVAGVIVAAFGDPGLVGARTACPCPVTGIAEAGMAEAAAGGRRFAVVTTTPALAGSIADKAAEYGHGDCFAGVILTPGDPAVVMADPGMLAEALLQACRAAVAETGAEALLIGGGPLARAARSIAARVPVPVIEPVPAAVRLALARAGLA